MLSVPNQNVYVRLSSYQQFLISGCLHGTPKISKISSSVSLAIRVPRVNLTLPGPRIVSLNSPLWFNPIPFLLANNRRDRLNMSFPVK